MNLPDLPIDADGSLRPRPAPPDFSTERRAKSLALQIERRWHQAGHPDVRTWIEKRGDKRSRRYEIRSNLVNGLPPKKVSHDSD